LFILTLERPGVLNVSVSVIFLAGVISTDFSLGKKGIVSPCALFHISVSWDLVLI
jgi:hypothetical protein